MGPASQTSARPPIMSYNHELQIAKARKATRPCQLPSLRCAQDAQDAPGTHIRDPKSSQCQFPQKRTQAQKHAARLLLFLIKDKGKRMIVFEGQTSRCMQKAPSARAK